MKKHRGTALLLAVVSLGLSLITTSKPASARSYTTVPASLRGHRYHYDSEYGMSQLKASKYHFDTKSDYSGSWYRLSGKKFPSYAMGHSEMVVKQTPKHYYVVAKYATDSFHYWKKVTHIMWHYVLLYLITQKLKVARRTGISLRQLLSILASPTTMQLVMILTIITPTHQLSCKQTVNQ